VLKSELEVSMKALLAGLLVVTVSRALEAPQVAIDAQCDGDNTNVTLTWPPVPGAGLYDIYWAPTAFSPMSFYESVTAPPFQTAIPTGWNWQDQSDRLGFFSVIGYGEDPEEPMQIAYYPFNGNANNELGTGHDCIIEGPVFAEDRHGSANSCLRFDGINDYVWMPEPILESPLSISCWFKTDNDASVRNMMIMRHRSFGYAIQFYVFDGQIKLWVVTYVSNGSQFYSYISQANEFFDSNWHHCAITYDESIYKVFMDGELIYESNIYGFNNPAFYINYGTSFGRDGDVNSRYYDGYLDDVRYYNYAITDQEVMELYYE
jgi:hypothetical protein